MNFDNYFCDGQMTIFDFLNADKERLTIRKKIRLIELFAGIGSQAMSLRDLGADFEHHRVVEFDKYACKAYSAIHGVDVTPTDINDITGEDLGITDKDKYTYLLTYSFPCTDLSVAGKMLGMEEGSGTRSSLLWQVKRLLTETKELPDILVMENVTQIHSKKNNESFQKWIKFLDGLGYTSVWEDMNAKNFGVAQSRDRTIMVSWLGNYTYKFPQQIPLEKNMDDYLFDEVDEKFYVVTPKAYELIDRLVTSGQIPFDEQMEIEVVGDIYEDNGQGSMAGRVYSPGGLAPCLNASNWREPIKVMTWQRVK